MSIGIEHDHVEFAGIARQFLANRDAAKAARAALDDAISMPMYWSELVELGWLGLHVPEDLGGSGYGLMETAVIAEELGRVNSPGPFVPTVAVLAAVATAGTDDQKATFVRDLVEGTITAGLAVAETDGTSFDGAVLKVESIVVLGGAAAAVIAVVVGDDVVLLDRDDPGLKIDAPAGSDPGLGFVRMTCTGVEIDAERIVAAAAAPLRHAVAVAVAALAAGGAAACQEMATAYAKDRMAFGRPIGQFQAVKHHCADMFVNQQLASAAVWNVARLDHSEQARPFAHAALAEALAAFESNANLNIQVHGGIGYTWEHDAHIFLRRSTSLLAFCGPLDRVRAAAAPLGLDAAASRVPLELPPEAGDFRASAREFVAGYWELPDEDRHAAVLDGGYLFPNWPAPWGRSAGPVEQLVLEEELKPLKRMKPLGPTGWTLPINIPTLLTHGTDDQQQRWIRPTLEGRLAWCQLMSEPSAGSDLAALSTKASRTDGGWLLTGQKVWTSNAHDADVGFALVRTDPNDKHGGITCMVVDMRSEGVTIRPLRQITGSAHFNEVFLDEVFVPDDDVVGAVGEGWNVTRTSLGNERVSIAEGNGWAPPPLLQLIDERATSMAEQDPTVLAAHGQLAARASAISALHARGVARALAGGERGDEGNLSKLVVAEFAQDVCAFGMRVAGPDAVFADGASGNLLAGFLVSRAATIAGGTSEIMRNVIGERMLGLPRSD